MADAVGMHHTRSPRRWLVGIEATTGALASVGGVLLVIRPDGGLIGARTDVLEGSPFSSWLVPGVLLLLLVGGSFLTTALYVSVSGRFAPELSVVAGAGLVVFESCEVVWLGLQPLEVVFMGVGVAVVALGLRLAHPDRDGAGEPCRTAGPRASVRGPERAQRYLRE